MVGNLLRMRGNYQIPMKRDEFFGVHPEAPRASLLICYETSNILGALREVRGTTVHAKSYLTMLLHSGRVRQEKMDQISGLEKNSQGCLVFEDLHKRAEQNETRNLIILALLFLETVVA